MDIKKNTFAENLKSLRKIKGIKQSDLAEALNISIKTVSHWETEYTEPCILQLIQLAEYFDISIDELVGKI